MKAAMRKLQVLVFHAERDAVLDGLQDLGLVHVVAETPAAIQSPAEALRARRTRYEKALEVLEQVKVNATAPTAPPPDADALATAVHQGQEAQQEARQQRRQYRQEVAALTPWGDFDEEKLRRLEAAGLSVGFFGTPRRPYRRYRWPAHTAHAVVSARKDYLFIWAVCPGEFPPDLPFDRLELPPHRLSERQQKLRDTEARLAALADERVRLAPHAHLLRTAIAHLDDQLDYLTAQASLAPRGEGRILRLRGWLPTDRVATVADWLRARQLTFTLSEPGPDEAVPVELRNPRYPRLFEPITRIFQLPHYYEFDLTPLVAVFYPIFFGYCLGDAGYGLLVLLGAVVARFTFLKKSPDVAALGMVLGAVTMVVGILKSGTVLGIPITERPDLPLLGFLARFVVVPDDQHYVFNAFNVALIIGLVQILTGVVVAIVRKARYGAGWSVLATVGKLLLIVGLLVSFLGGMQRLALFVPWLPVAYGLLGVGTLLVLGFHDPRRKLAARIGSGFLPLYFILTGLLGDSLSYIRLFALGVASSILGLVVNQIGQQIMDNGGVMIGVGILFLIFGHALNLSLAALGAFVHPLRLTFVEFYNNAEFAGGGEPFRPFRRRRPAVTD